MVATVAAIVEPYPFTSLAGEPFCSVAPWLNGDHVVAMWLHRRGDAEALSNHGKQGAASSVEALYGG
ncbi:MAG: hypothetical protein WBA29_02060 [Xanthobacteraceae bacterium]